MDHLLDGYRRFRRDVWPAQRARFEQMAEGQSPQTMIIACSDSRIDPQTVFGAGPGELFVVRNVANLVPPCESRGSYHGTSAAIEFAVERLKVERILIMGHARCGGVRAFLEGTERKQPAESFIEKWISLLGPAYEALLASGLPDEADARQRLMEQVSVTQSIETLLSFPFVKTAVADRKLRLQGGFFDVSTGQLQLLDAETKRFEAIEA